MPKHSKTKRSATNHYLILGVYCISNAGIINALYKDISSSVVETGRRNKLCKTGKVSRVYGYISSKFSCFSVVVYFCLFAFCFCFKSESRLTLRKSSLSCNRIVKADLRSYLKWISTIWYADARAIPFNILRPGENIGICELGHQWFR